MHGKREWTKKGEEEGEKEINSNKQSAFVGPTQCPCQHNAHTKTMPPMTLPTHWWHWERQKEYVRELFNIFDAHLLAQWLPLLWPPALWEVEMPPINAKCNNQPGAKRKPTKRAWGWGNDLKSKNNKQPAMWGQCKDYVNAMPMPMQCLHKATANTIHPSMVWGNYNFKINWQE